MFIYVCLLWLWNVLTMLFDILSSNSKIFPRKATNSIAVICHKLQTPKHESCQKPSLWHSPSACFSTEQFLQSTLHSNALFVTVSAMGGANLWNACRNMALVRNKQFCRLIDKIYVLNLVAKWTYQCTFEFIIPPLVITRHSLHIMTHIPPVTMLFTNKLCVTYIGRETVILRVIKISERHFPFLIFGVCIVLRVWDQGEGVFPSTQRYYRRFLLFIIHVTATCFGRTTIF
jgi:hypothetical protein